MLAPVPVPGGLDGALTIVDRPEPPRHPYRRRAEKDPGNRKCDGQADHGGHTAEHQRLNHLGGSVYDHPEADGDSEVPLAGPSQEAHGDRRVGSETDTHHERADDEEDRVGRQRCDGDAENRDPRAPDERLHHPKVPDDCGQDESNGQ